jgi:hypothetical protein
MLPVTRLNLSKEETKEIEELITEYEYVFFSTNNRDCERTGRVHHHIDNGDDRRDRQLPTRISSAKIGRSGRETRVLQQSRVIEESHSPWFSTVVLA